MCLTLMAALGVLAPTRQMPTPAGLDFWDEPVAVQKASPREFHPVLRFMSSSTYMLTTPDFIQQGKFSVSGSHYYFRAVTAMELENYFKDRLVEAMNPSQARLNNEAYARSMQNFEGDYEERTGSLEFTYRVKGNLRSFHVYRVTGDRPYPAQSADAGDQGLVGLWQGPDRFPERLDGKVRYKIGGLEGLQDFAKEADASEGSLMSFIDLYPNHQYRVHGKSGIWVHNGSQLTLIEGSDRIILNITSDGKLKAGNTVVFVR